MCGLIRAASPDLRLFREKFLASSNLRLPEPRRVAGANHLVARDLGPLFRIKSQPVPGNAFPRPIMHPKHKQRFL